MKQKLLQAMVVLLAGLGAHAQVNSGSNGSDGALNPTTNIVVNMADHPTGIYHYTSVNISNGVNVTFIPNANNTPVVWLVQGDCTIAGKVDVSAQTWPFVSGQLVSQGGGPGGHRGGNGGSAATAGLGPGGGNVGSTNTPPVGGNASFGTLGGIFEYYVPQQPAPGATYGNNFLLPLMGGSGGGGSRITSGQGIGGGGGGAILIAASGTITVVGSILANGAKGGLYDYWSSPVSIPGGGGSGGGIRLVASHIAGPGGTISAAGGGPYGYNSGDVFLQSRAGSGRVRFDTMDNTFGGNISGAFTQGFQPIIIPAAGQGVQLAITSVGGVPVSASPTGGIATPDAVLSAQQNNPISIVVHCSNIPLNSQITVSVRPANGATVSATGLNSTGTLSSSTATVLINMPRGGGIIYATAATGN